MARWKIILGWSREKIINLDDFLILFKKEDIAMDKSFDIMFQKKYSFGDSNESKSQTSSKTDVTDSETNTNGKL